MNGRNIMLLREFTIDDHTICLIQENDLYIAKITNSKGEKVLYHEYNDYERIKGSFDEIVQAIEEKEIDINDVISIIEKNPE